MTPAAADPVSPAGPAQPAPAARATPAPAPPARQQDDALDLGATVLPILAKTYWKQALAVVVVIALVIWLIVG